MSARQQSAKKSNVRKLEGANEDTVVPLLSPDPLQSGDDTTGMSWFRKEVSPPAAGAAAPVAPRAPTGPIRGLSRAISRTGVANMSSLSEDALLHIATFLDTRDNCRLAICGRTFAAATRNPVLWDDLLARDFRPPKTASVRGLGGNRVLDAMRNAASRISMRAIGGGAAANNTNTATLPLSGSGRNDSQGYAPGYGATSTRSSLDKYKELYRDRARRVADMKERARRAEAQRAIIIPKRRLRITMDVCQYMLGLGLPMWYPLAFLVMLYIKLTQDPADLSWPHVFIPWFMLLAHPWVFGSFGLLSDCCSRCFRGPSIFDDQTNADRKNIVHFFVRYCKMQKEMWDYSCCSSFFCCIRLGIAFGNAVFAVASVVSVCLKLQGTISVSWATALIPVWILFAFAMVCPFAGWVATCFSDEVDFDEEGRCDACLRDTAMSAGGCFMIIFILVTIALLVARLDGSTSMKLVQIFIPLWILNGCFMLGGCGGTIAAVISGDDCCERLGACAGSCLTWAIVSLPMLSEIFLAIDDSKGSFNAGRAIIPWIVFAVVVGIGGCVAAMVAWQSAREDTQSELYDFSEPHWQGCGCRRQPQAFPAGAAALPNPMRNGFGSDNV